MKHRPSCLCLIVVLCSFHLLWTATAAARVQGDPNPEERPIILKGLSLGMDIQEARKICINLLSKGWNISAIGPREKVMGDYNDSYRRERLPDMGKRGFLIKNKGGYISGFGFISEEGGKVSQITFSGELTEYIFSARDVETDAFVSDFIKAFKLPELQWIKHGWFYASPNGYELTFMNDKAMDLKKSDKGKHLKRTRFD